MSDLYAVGRVRLYSTQRFESALYVQRSKSVGSTSLYGREDVYRVALLRVCGSRALLGQTEASVSFHLQEV